MRFVFLMDGPETVRVDEDTSFALMLEAQARGHRVDHCLLQDLYLRDGQPYAHVHRVRMQRDSREPVTRLDAEDVPLRDVDAVLVRKDPPFDEMYLWATHLLDTLQDVTPVLNAPHGLRQANEKIYACQFPEVMPETLVSSDKPRIKRFMKDVGGRAVIKPLHGAGGEGVMVLHEGDLNVNAIIEAQTLNGRRYAMVQRFLPEVTEGDKRILLLDGKPLGAIVRVPQSDDLRSNIHVGGSVVAGDVTPHDEQIIERLRPSLKADGLWFVGLDVIGGRLTEVNVTSPTGIQQMSRLMGEHLAGVVLDGLEERVG